MSFSSELPFGMSAIDVAPGNTNDYWDGVRAAYERGGRAMPALGEVAGAGAEVAVDFTSVEAPAPFEFPTAEIR